jgi:hypothetical protein
MPGRRHRWDDTPYYEDDEREAEMGEWHNHVDSECTCTWPAGKEHNKYNWGAVFEQALTVCDWHRELQAEIEERQARFKRWRAVNTYIDVKLLWLHMFPQHSKRGDVLKDLRGYVAAATGWAEAHPEKAAEVAATLK